MMVGCVDVRKREDPLLIRLLFIYLLAMTAQAPGCSSVCHVCNRAPSTTHANEALQRSTFRSTALVERVYPSYIQSLHWFACIVKFQRTVVSVGDKSRGRYVLYLTV